MSASQTKTRKVELHTHSTASDGSLAPRQLAEACARRGVQVWSLTDHDTCAGCPGAAAAARALGVEFVAGIEISAYVDGRSVHVLGYGVDPQSTPIVELADALKKARLERMRRMLEECASLGVQIELRTVEEIAGEASLSRAHLSKAIRRSGAVETIEEAFDQYIGYDAPAYVPVGWPSVTEAISRIHRAGGAAVLAHPARHEIDEYIPRWSEEGLDGLEVGHPTHTPEERDAYAALADRLDLLTTVSSDFHGEEHTHSAALGETDLEATTIDALFAAIDRYR